jgi:hypothetical protein
MSAFGTKRTSELGQTMSAFGGKADIGLSARRHLRRPNIAHAKKRSPGAGRGFPCLLAVWGRSISFACQDAHASDCKSMLYEVMASTERLSSETTKPPAVRSQRLCLVPHRPAFLGGSRWVSNRREQARSPAFLRGRSVRREKLIVVPPHASFTNCNGIFRPVMPGPEADHYDLKTSWPETSATSQTITTVMVIAKKHSLAVKVPPAPGIGAYSTRPA